MKNIKNLLSLILTVLLLASCSDSSEDIDTNTKSNFKITYSQNGDLEEGVLVLNFITPAPIPDYNSQSVLTSDTLNESKTYTFETSQKTNSFSFNYTHSFAYVMGINDTKEITTSIKVYKDDVLIYDENFILNKDNINVQVYTSNLNDI